MNALPPTTTSGASPSSRSRRARIASRTRTRCGVMEAESATTAGRRAATISTRLSMGVVAPRNTVSHPSSSRRSQIMRSPISWRSASAHAATRSGPSALPSVNRSSYSRAIAAWVIAVARCSSATVMRFSCQSRPTSRSAGWNTSRYSSRCSSPAPRAASTAAKARRRSPESTASR
ncbi:MAG TPA: hypothetical protein VF263_11945 [Longimicrobiaceae bacterium]